MPISEVYNEDCMIGMARYPDKFFDLAIVDPPYGISYTERGNGDETKDSSNWINHAIKKWDNVIPEHKYFAELFRVSVNQIIWGGNYFIKHLTNSRCWVSWDKIQDFSGSDFELAWTSFNTPAKSFKMARCVAYTNQLRVHPTQKPVALYKWLLRNYGKPGDKILDTHLGSQSSRIAAWDGGFDFWGWELDEDYYRDGCKRFENHIKQLTFAL